VRGIVRHSLILEMCECRQHPRSVWVEWVLRSWANGRAYLTGRAPRPVSKSPMPDWFR
jgi:hypothetical protein